MDRKDILKELKIRGYKAEKRDVIKNGIKMEGIEMHKTDSIGIVIYISDIIKRIEETERSFGDALDDAVAMTIEIYEKSGLPNLNPDDLQEKEFIMKHLYVGLQRDSEEPLIKRQCGFDGIESYLYARMESGRDDEVYIMKVNKGLLFNAGITENEAWMKAYENTCAETIIEPMLKSTARLCGEEYTREMQMIDEIISAYIITNRINQHGASAVLNKKMILQFMKEKGVNKIIALPSSIHEMILILDTEMNIKEMSDMVKEVNINVLSSKEKLADRAYVIDIDEIC